MVFVGLRWSLMVFDEFQKFSLEVNYVLFQPAKPDGFQWYSTTFGLVQEHSVTLSPLIMYNITSVPSTDCSAGDICWSKIIFKWPHQTKCSGELICQNMTGNICGNYGIVFTKLQTSQTICQERGGIEFSMQDKNDQIELELWHHYQYSTHLQCYLWCSKSGAEPVVSRSQTESQLFAFRTNLRSITSDQALSPHYIYAFNQSLVVQTKKNCQKDKCLSVHTLNWYNRKSCQANAICPKLTGNVCGDYALGVLFKNISNSQAHTLCERSDVIQGGLESNGRLMIYIYSNPKHEMNFQCYVWCTPDGSLPDEKSHSHHVTEPMVKSIAAVHLSNNTYLSPVKFYKFDSNVTVCDKVTCEDVYYLHWALDEPCQLKMVCLHLDSQICASHGLILQNQDICFANQTFVQELKHSVGIRLWDTFRSATSMECYVWCDHMKQDFKANHSSLISWHYLESKLHQAKVMTTFIMSSSTEDILVSPFHVYQVKASKGDFEKEQSLTFQWMRHGSCRAQFVCEVLEGPVCGEYFLWIDEKPICFENMLFESTLNETKTFVSVKMRKVPVARPFIDCYFWCSEDGAIPVKASQSSTQIKSKGRGEYFGRL